MQVTSASCLGPLSCSPTANSDHSYSRQAGKHGFELEFDGLDLLSSALRTTTEAEVGDEQDGRGREDGTEVNPGHAQ